MAATGHVDTILAPKAAATEKSYAAGRSVPASAAQFTPDDMPSGVSRIVEGACKLFEVRSMLEHVQLMQRLLARHVTYDVPPILINDREDMRIAIYLAKSIARLTFKPELMSVQPLGNERTIVDLEGTCYVMPKLPLLLLLPKSVGIKATIRLGVKGPLDSGKIELIDGQWHNLPRLPTFIREFNGLMMGTLPHVTLPLWSWTLQYVGEDYYKQLQQPRHDRQNAPQQRLNGKSD